MFLEAARGLSVFRLLRVLNQKLGLECTRLRDTLPSPVTPGPPLHWNLRWPHVDWSLPDERRTPMNNRSKTRSQCTRDFENDPTLAEPVAINQQVTTGDHFSYRSMCPGQSLRDEVDCSVDSRMPLLARGYTIRHNHLDVVTQLPDQPNGIEPGAIQSSSSSTHPRCAAGLEYYDLMIPYIQNIETISWGSLVAVEDFTQTLPNFSQSMPNL